MSEDIVRPPKLFYVKGRNQKEKDKLAFDKGYDGGSAYLYEYVDEKLHVSDMQKVLEEWGLDRYRKEWIILDELDFFDDASIAKIRKIVRESYGVTNLDASDSEGRETSS